MITMSRSIIIPRGGLLVATCNSFPRDLSLFVIPAAYSVLVKSSYKLPWYTCSRYIYVYLTMVYYRYYNYIIYYNYKIGYKIRRYNINLYVVYSYDRMHLPAVHNISINRNSEFILWPKLSSQPLFNKSKLSSQPLFII